MLWSINGDLWKRVTLAFETSRISKGAADVRWPGLQRSCTQKSGRRGWLKAAQKQECKQALVYSGLRETGGQGHRTDV